MIYLDSAATSLMKPRRVAEAAAAAIRNLASPGRGGHYAARRASDIVFRCREEIAALFNLTEPERVVFTMNATHGLNIAIRGLISEGDRVVISGYEHNAVTRPLNLIGADVSIAASPLFDPEAALSAFKSKLPGARAAICTHVSNVFGFELPIYKIAECCRDAGVPLIVDASQSAGVLNIDASRLGAEFIAMPGHKGLLGPQGTGVLLCMGSAKPLLAGGTGSDSRSANMPDYLPDMLEAGTHNVCGIAGLREGVAFVRARGCDKIAAHERGLTALLTAQLAEIPGLRVYSEEMRAQSGVLSVRHEKIGSEELASRLSERGVAVRAGLHCAPLAHETAGTSEGGTVRLSLSPFNTRADVQGAASAMRNALRAQ